MSVCVCVSALQFSCPAVGLFTRRNHFRIRSLISVLRLQLSNPCRVFLDDPLLAVLRESLFISIIETKFRSN